MTRYQAPISNELLDQRPWPPVEGFRLISVDEPWQGSQRITLCTVEDDNAPATFEGQLVEPTFGMTGDGIYVQNRRAYPPPND